MDQQITIMPGVFYSTPQTARALGTSERTLEAWRNKGDGPEFTRMGRRMVRYKGENLLKFLDERTFNSTSEEAQSAA